MTDPKADLVDALAQLSFVVVNALTEIAGEYDLSVVQVRLLGVLRDRQPNMNGLGRHLGLDKSSISGLVDRAERRGLVARTPSETDRRSMRVSITDAGRELGGKIAVEFSARIETFTAGLSPEEQRLLTELADRIVTADARRHGIDLRAL